MGLPVCERDDGDDDDDDIATPSSIYRLDSDMALIEG